MTNREGMLKEYVRSLRLSEKSDATIKKYTRVVEDFLEYIGEQELIKEVVLAYKERLQQVHAATGVNAKLAAVNSYLKFLGKDDCRVANEKIQRKLFISEERELTQQEYQRLLRAAEGKRIYYMMKCICETGIRVSELPFITVDAVRTGTAVVKCKNKTRQIFLSRSLCKELKDYVRKNNVVIGSVFVTKTGKPIFKTKVWSEMKALCKDARVSEKKVFPHNLRHLFARTFYELKKDIVKLADLLGHSSIQTTRIYTISSGEEHRKSLEELSEELNKCAS